MDLMTVKSSSKIELTQKTFQVVRPTEESFMKHAEKEWAVIICMCYLPCRVEE